ncbi:MAG: EamA family transporter [Longimicrobiales bacterium]
MPPPRDVEAGANTRWAGSGRSGLKTSVSGANAPAWKVVAAFAAVYVIWGSTYLGILIAIETMPPFLMAGTRFVIAGGLIYGWSRLRGQGRPARSQWQSAMMIGTLLLMGGNGAVTWAEQRIPSGVAALMVAITPCWMVLLEWLRPGGTRPTRHIIAGLLLGITGIALLVGPQSLMGGERIDLIGAGVLMVGSLSWATGSIYSKHARMLDGPFVTTGMQMLCGGGMLVLLALVTGDFGRLDLAGISLRSVVAFAYLIGFGAIIGYSAYIWLLRVSTPAKVSTYAYVNPVVAVLLGWAFAGEELTARMGVAALVIIAGVALITLSTLPRSVPGPSPGTSGTDPYIIRDAEVP